MDVSTDPRLKESNAKQNDFNWYIQQKLVDIWSFEVDWFSSSEHSAGVTLGQAASGGHENVPFGLGPFISRAVCVLCRIPASVVPCGFVFSD